LNGKKVLILEGSEKLQLVKYNFDKENTEYLNEKNKEPKLLVFKNPDWSMACLGILLII
jgi:hypothetical protein